MSADEAGCGWKPTEERICGQGPGSSASTANPKLRGGALGASAAAPAISMAGARKSDAATRRHGDTATRRHSAAISVSKCIPESGAEIEEVRLAKAVLRKGVG